MKGFLEYIPGNSIIHRLDPRTKILLPLILCASCFTSSNIYILLGILGFDFILGFAGGIGKKTIKTFINLLKVMVFLFILQILFVQSGNELLPLILGLKITDDGLMTGVMVVLRLIAVTLPLTTLLSLTKMSSLSNALVQKWRVPYKYAFAITTSINFIPSFATSMAETVEAQTARGVDFDTKNPFKKLGLIFPLCVPLLISSVKKIDGNAAAAELRGFNLRKRENCFNSSSFGILDLLAFITVLLILMSAIIL